MISMAWTDPEAQSEADRSHPGMARVYKIQNHREIEPALVSSDAGDIRNELFSRSGGRVGLGQKVG